jgi:hypothetical protein
MKGKKKTDIGLPLSLSPSLSLAVEPGGRGLDEIQRGGTPRAEELGEEEDY